MAHKSKHPQNNPPAKPKQDSGEEKSTNRHVYVEPGVQIDFVQDLKKKHDTERLEASTHEKKKFVAELVTIILIAIYAAITGWQGCLTRESIDNNSKQFQIDQRPYLWTTNTNPQISIVAGQRVWANIQMADYGKAPAIKLRVAGMIFFGPTAKNDADVWFNGLADKVFTDPDMSEFVVPPGIPSLFPPTPKRDVSKDDVGKHESKPEAPFNAGFGGGGYFTVMSEKVLSQPDVDYILGTDQSAFIVARLQYFDAFGNRYWTNVCMSRFTSGAIPDCPRHNEIH